MIQKIGPVNLKGKVYDSLKKYILSLNIYLKESDFHLDERQLSEKLGVSRTPIREAVAKLEQEGIVKTVPRRGVFVHRKSKKEEIESLNKYCHYSKENVLSELDNYSNDNIKFHNQIMKLTKVKLMGEILESQLIHLQYLRKKFVIESHRAVKSIDEHNDIVRSLVAGHASKAEKLLKNHALTLVDKIQESIHS